MLRPLCQGGETRQAKIAKSPEPAEAFKGPGVAFRLVEKEQERKNRFRAATKRMTRPGSPRQKQDSQRPLRCDAGACTWLHKGDGRAGSARARGGLDGRGGRTRMGTVSP